MAIKPVRIRIMVNLGFIRLPIYITLTEEDIRKILCNLLKDSDVSELTTILLGLASSAGSPQAAGL